VPWLPFAVIDHLSELLESGSRVFEFGGGGSTLWFADRGMLVTTAEHDPEWHALIAATAPPTCELLLPVGAGAYAESIDEQPDGTFDLVLIDGQDRMRCIAHAIVKVRPGGHLVLDDSHLPAHEPAQALLRTWPRRELGGLAPGKAIPGHTTIWQRPIDQ
jgi:predicted O-methyltransferase YrrM